MANVKDLLLSIDDGGFPEDELDIYADSVKQSLEIASKELNVDISMLDYEIVEKGTKGFLGIGRQPYRVLVRPIKAGKEYEDLDKIERKLSGVMEQDLVLHEEKNANGRFTIRVTKSGIWLTVYPTKGTGKPVNFAEVSDKLMSLRITGIDNKKVEKETHRASKKPVRLGDWMPNPEYDGTMRVEVAEDEMHAYVHFVPPRFSGRHMEEDDVLDSLKNSGVLVGIKEDDIKQYLEKMDYSKPLKAAEGEKPIHGKDAYIDYKVRVDKSDISFEEDEKGQVDFRDLDLLENVVIGQVLAVKVPSEDGVPGRTVTNRVLPARTGKDIQMKYGKNTILSEDGMELTAATNGQVVFKDGKIYVEEVLLIKGDVSLETGNITCLGSVVISGSVQDNFIVKAAGNIEVKGTVQKATIEAEGDIVIRQGIVGRDEAKIESTGGSVYAKFVQRTNVVAEKDVIVSEGILHSKIDAGGRVICHGKRAKIVGGIVRAGEEINALYIGSDSFTKTEVWAGVNPKVLQQLTDLQDLGRQIGDELEQVTKNKTTLSIQQKNAGGKLPKEKEELLNKLKEQQKKLTSRQNELGLEMEELKSYLNMLEHSGKICVEKTAYPGVTVFIKDKRFPVNDPYNYIKFTLDGNDIRLSEYESTGKVEEKHKIITRSRSNPG